MINGSGLELEFLALPEVNSVTSYPRLQLIWLMGNAEHLQCARCYTELFKWIFLLNPHITVWEKYYYQRKGCSSLERWATWAGSYRWKAALEFKLSLTPKPGPSREQCTSIQPAFPFESTTCCLSVSNSPTARWFRGVAEIVHKEKHLMLFKKKYIS